MSIFDARYDRLSEIKKKRAANSPAQSGEVKAAGAVKASPFDGYAVTSRPGKRNAPTAGASTNHAGLDRAMPRGTALKLPIDVTYYRSGSDKARGKWIEFKDAGGNILHYQHLDSYGIFKPGETVPAGSQIAVSGASGIGTGAHLHEEYWSPDGQNITESYWGELSKGTASGALPTEYKKAGGNVFNAGTNALAREGKTSLAGSYEGLSRFEKVQMLKNRRKERERYDEAIRKYSSPLGSRRGQRENKVGVALSEKIDGWVRNENANARAYNTKMSDVAAASEARLSDGDFMTAAVDGYQRARGKAEGWGNRNKTWGREQITQAKTLSKLGGNRGVRGVRLGTAHRNIDKLSLAEYMTDTEVLTYSGLLNTEGEKKAEEYLNAIRDKLRARAYEHKQYPQRFADTAKTIYNNPYGLPEGYYQKKSVFDSVEMPGEMEKAEKDAKEESYVKSVAKSVGAGFTTAGALLETAAQARRNAISGEYEPVNVYDPAFDSARKQSVIQTAATEGDSQWVKFLKSAGLSIAGSLASSAAGAPLGPGGSLAIMGASAAGQSAFEGAERGLTPAQVTTLGAVNGALEAATEMIPVKNIFKAFKSKSAARELAKEILQAGFENAEQEAINTLAGNIADEIITGDRSELMTSAREYAAKLQQEKGLSNEQAISEGLKKATIDKYITEPLYSAASGAFSGAVQTGASAASGRAAADISDTVRAYSAGQNAAAAIDKLGYKIKYTDDPGLDGKVDKGAKTVYFNREGDNIRQTVKHEISHMLENNEKYGEFRSFVKEEMPQAYKAAQRRVSDRLERVNAYREERGLSKYKSDAETIEAETFAELAEVLKSDRLIRRFALGADMPKTMRVIEFARDASARLSEKLGTDGGWSTAARKWAAALSEAQADESGVRNKLSGVDDEGVEIYRTTDETKKMPYAQKKKKFIDIMKNEYRGRTARFEKNGVVYYARFEDSDVRKNVYGDKNSDQSGYDAKINTGADGGIFDLIENAGYAYSSSEDGKKTKSHRNVKGWDYFVKTVNIDGQYFDVFANVRRRADGEFVYDVQLNENKNRATPPVAQQLQKQKGVGSGAYRSVYIDSVAQKGDTVNSNIRKSNTNDTNVRNKIAENEKGKYVQAQRQVIKSDNPQDWESEIINYVNNVVRGGKDLEITLDNGEKLKITKRTAWKLGYRNGKNENNPISDKIYMVKGNASGVIDEVASVSKFSNSKAAKKVHSGDFGKSGFDYRTAYFRDLDGEYYKLTLSVGKNADGKEIYNIGSIKKSTFPGRKLSVLELKGSGKGTTDSVAQKGNTVNSNVRKSNTNDTNTQNKIRDVEDIKSSTDYLRREIKRLEWDNRKMRKGQSEEQSTDTGEKQRFASYDEYLEHRYSQLLKENKKLHSEYDAKYFNSYGDYLSNRIDRAEEKNRQLEQIRKTLEHMANVAGEVHVDALKISDYAAELKRQTASKMPRREIAARLEDIYTGLAKSDPTDDGTRAYNALFELADDMLSASDRVDRSMYEQYAPLREFLRSTPISLAKSDRADIADWRDFVNRNRGRIRISEKGTGVDAIYEQLAAEYPEFFAESGYTHPADRLKHIARVRDSLDPVYNNQRHTDDEAAILAQSMFANYFSDENASIEHQTLLDLIRGKLERDIADKYEEKYRKEIEHHKERVEYYKNIDKKVAERAAAAEGGETAPEYVDTDVTDEYLYKYVKNIKFEKQKKKGVQPYSEQEKANWKNSKSIIVYENNEQFDSFVKKALNNEEVNKKIYFGKISEPTAKMIFDKTGVNVAGHNIALKGYEVRKILLNSHGDKAREAARGQEAITAEDLKRIPDIITQADNVTLSEKEYEGKPALLFEKNIDGKNYIVAYVSGKHQDVAIQTMYKKRSLATAENANANSSTSETTDSTASDDSVSQNEENVKGGVRILRRKYADRESVVIDFDRPTVYRDAKPGEYTMSDDPVYKDIMERVKRRQKIEENWHEGETREGTLPYDAQNIWRNMRKFFGERDYAEMKKRVLDPLDDSKRQYEYIQRFYSNIIYEKVVKELGIKMGSRLSALTQMYGEGVLTEEDLGTISEADMKKIKKADEIFRTVYDGLLDTINDSRKAIYPNAQDKVKKIEEEIAELRQEMFLIEAGYTSGDFSELDPKKWENLKQIDIRRESAEELIYRAQAAAKERVASLDGKIEQVEARLFKLGNRKDLKTYQELIDRRDRLVVRRSEIMNLTEAKVDKLKAMAQRLTNQFDENSSVYKEKLAKRLAALNRREGELIGELATDEITYGRLIQRRRDYYHHFEELADMVPEFLGYMKVHADDKASVADRIKGYINSRGLRHNKNIDNRLAGKSADTKPKAKWQSFAQRRTQTETVNYDAVGGFKRYVAAAAYSAAIDPNISIFRALADDLAMPIDGKPSDKSMGGFIDYLRKYANELAGKSNEYGDRFVARIVGRNWWNRLNRLSSRIKSNQVVYNVSCSTAQILNVPQAIAYMRNHPVALNGAIVDTVWGALPGKNEIKERYKYSSFLTERFSDNYTRFEALPKRTLDNIANFMLGALDEAGTKYIWNAAYRSAIAEGSKTPVRYADDVTRRMVAGRGIGELPYYQKSKLVGMLIPFTLESGNVWDAVGDMMRDSAQKHGVDTKQGLARKAAKVGAGVDFGADLLVLFVMNHLFNYIIEKIRGTDGGLFDPIADIKEGVRNNKGVLKTAGLIAGDFVGSFPVGGFAAGVYPEYGIELPGGINLPSRRAIFGDSDPTRFGTNGGVFLSAVKDPAHMLIPKAGGAQAREIGKAMYASYNGAVRTRSGKVKYELSDKSLYNIIRGLTFGTSALTETEDYYNQKEVNFHGVPDGFEYKHKSREVTLGYDKVELRGDDLEQYETLRLARYKRLAQNDNTAFALRNPYGTPEKGWSAEKKKQYEADRDRMKTVLVGLYEQGSITKDRLREIYSAYKNGGDIRVRGVEYYAPTKVKREKKYSELTEYQRSDFKKKLDRDVKSGKLAVEDKEEYARMIRNKEWDFIATVDEYLTGDIKDLSKEEKKKVYSQINSLSTEFATRIWRERRDSWFDKWKIRRSGQLYKPAGVEKN